MAIITELMPTAAGATGVRVHWNSAYDAKASGELSWYEEIPRASLALINEAQLPREAAIVDIGGGDSGLAGMLVAAGYTDVTVVDISVVALRRAMVELGGGAASVRWVEADVCTTDLDRQYDLWHDRAVFHFMVEKAHRDRYLAALRRAVRPGGRLIIATFGPDGPTRCSGLPARRYSIEELTEVLPEFELLSSHLHDHYTPSGRCQQFLYAHLRRV